MVQQTETNLSEAEAISEARDGSATAFEFLYALHCGRVYSVCLRMVRNTAEAEDLTQQTFIHLFRKIGTFRGEAMFSTWLHRVTVNIVLMHLRRKKSTEIPGEIPESCGSSEENPRVVRSGDTSMLGAIDRLLKCAVSKLPLGCKQIFLMYDVMGYQHREIARLLGCSTGCSQSQLHKARKRLRRLLLCGD